MTTIFKTKIVSENVFVLYDPYSDRFIIGAHAYFLKVGEDSSYDASVLLAITQGSNPLRDGWYSYVLPLTNDILAPELLRPEQLGLGAWHNGIYMSTFVYGGDVGLRDGFLRIAVINRETIMKGEPLIGLYQDIADKDYIINNQIYYPLNTMVPNAGVTFPPTCENAYFADISCYNIGAIIPGIIVFHECKVSWNSFSGRTIRTTVYPPNYIIGGDYAKQKDTTVEVSFGGYGHTGTQRQSQYSNVDCKSSYWLSSTNISPSGLIWFQVRVKNGHTPKIFQQATIPNNGEFKRFSVDMAINKSGNVVLVATQSSKDTFPSTVYYYRFSTDPKNSMTQEKVIIAGTGSNVGVLYSEPPREVTEWGFNTVRVDPVDTTTFFISGDWFKTSVKGDWYTTICNLKL